MRRVVIHELPSYRVVSYGRGTSYTFMNLKAEASVYFQGDDALAFEQELRAYENAQPERSYESIFDELWDVHEYSERWKENYI